ncbi:MAG: hypothetical protein B6245_21040 [Desulfobacteraceae bacterium 4572_88]|nr:MAG: hypothetical protein B6245_21040 [Desulfobacteraceae bacterium 4572_88]
MNASEFISFLFHLVNIRLPAVNCRAIVVCPHGTKCLGINSEAESSGRLKPAKLPINALQRT